MSYIHIDNENLNDENRLDEDYPEVAFFVRRGSLMRQYHEAGNGWVKAQLGEEIARHEQSGVRLGLITEESIKC